MFANALRGAHESAPLKKVCGGPRTGKREDGRAAILCIQILTVSFGSLEMFLCTLH